MAKRSNPTLIGAFVLGALMLVVLGLLMLGGREWFTEKRRFVIYFDNSIKGLNVGAAVTFKGVVVGRVTSLQVRYVPETGKTEIPVLIDLDPAKVITAGQAPPGGGVLLQQMIGQGLRAQLNPESLITNQQIVQLDFFPGTAVRLVDSRLPYPQIPSLPSAFDQLEASLGMTAQSLPELATAAANTLNQISGVLTPENQKRVAHILENVDTLSSNLALHGNDLGKTLVSLQEASVQLNHLLGTLDRTVAENRQPLTQSIEAIGQSAQSLRVLSDNLTTILGDNRTGLRDFSNGALYDLAGLIADTRVLVRRATESLEQFNRAPSRFLFGDNDQGVPVR